MPGLLWERTRDLHHACEEHPVGAAMSKGEPPLLWYVGWLETLREIHSAIDHYVPPCAHRTERIMEDLVACEVGVETPKAAIEYARSLTRTYHIEGAAYVLTGAHLMGGEIMRRRLQGYPTRHLEWDNRKDTLAYLVTLRDRQELTQAARECFQALLDSMEEIQNGVSYNLPNGDW